MKKNKQDKNVDAILQWTKRQPHGDIVEHERFKNDTFTSTFLIER